MKYALLVYGDQSAWEALSEEEAQASRVESMPKWVALFEEMGRLDPNVDGKELDSASTAKTVRVRGGDTLISDGPFAETKEQIGGIFLTDLPDLDTAITLAAKIPAADHGSIEIRPILEH